MTPTNELRWVEREVTVKTNHHPMVMWVDENGRLTPPPADDTYISKVLQQRWLGEKSNAWTGQYELMDEWRDVPIEKEQP